jgi:transposase
MGIVVGGLDIHRAQITFDVLDTDTGEVSVGRIASTPAAVRAWVQGFSGREVHVAVEACTGWYFVVRALERAGAVAHLAEVSETRALRGPKRRAKTDRQDARWLRVLLCERRLPEAWIAPDHICWLRTRTRLRNKLAAQHTAWRQSLQATLFQLGLPRLPDGLDGDRAREWLAELELPAAMAERIEVCLQMMACCDRLAAPIERELGSFARRQPGCLALQQHFGIGTLAAAVTVAELGDVSRLRRSRQAVRLAGLDIGVSRSDRRSRAGKLVKQGSPQLRWALYEAAQSACRAHSPDHTDYLRLRERGLSHTRASLTIARKLARRCYHTLRELGPDAIAEPPTRRAPTR